MTAAALLPGARRLPESDHLFPGLPAIAQCIAEPPYLAYLRLNSGLAYALWRSESTATNRTSMDDEWNGSEMCSTTDSSNDIGNDVDCRRPRYRASHARPPSGPNWST